MTTETNAGLQELFERTARRFAEELRDRFPEAIRAIILYGSVARGMAHANSDIDVLVLRQNGQPTRDELAEISESIDFENGFKTFLIATALTRERLEALREGRFPIAEAILNEGRVLYDDGTFERIRASSSGVGRRDA